jgi:hypothetical protein
VLCDVRTTAIVVAAAGETSVEVVLPEGRSCLQLSCSGWSWVAGVDAVGGTPHSDFTNDGEVRAAARRRPHRLGFVMAGVTSYLVGEVGDELGPLRQILAPNGMIMKLCWNAEKPRKRPGVDGCRFWEAPVQHSGHVSCRVEFATGGRCVQVQEWMLTGLGRQGEQVCPQRRPGRLVGEFGDDLVGPAVEHLNDLGSEELLGRHMKAVGVTLDRVTQPGSRIAELAQQGSG